ncbi:IQ motif and SEC7 domain-containing protein 2-like isoform X4 [Ostrea edulis]|uniref:IQ motif and SEC7 domain-containing protein 2-like isoform X4 n=1 Tax=Ostrea edulis TaxID=37623 RepID=UPI0024AFA1E1|nr:IQ motif and SEC7 domain-containing protein 2-like isoform X4 [Ostrea edulis]
MAFMFWSHTRYMEKIKRVTSSHSGEEFLRNKNRSRSVGGSPLESPRSSRLLTQTSLHSNRCQRQRSFRRNEDEIKRSRSQSVAYELSQDLQDKQVEMLERKYGGSIRSRRAAKIIQRAFRQYTMNKNFEKLRIAVGERRFSKRLSELGRSNTVSADAYFLGGSPILQGNGELQRHSDILGKRVDSDKLRFGENRLRQQMSLDQNVRFDSQLPFRRSSDKRKLERHKEVDLTDIPKDLKSVSNETNNNRNSCPEMNESSASDSPQPTPVDSTIDPHSLDCETLLENKDTGIVLAESFHSDQSHADGSLYLGGYNHKKMSASSLYSNASTDTLENNKSESYDSYKSNFSDSGSYGSQGDLQIRIDNIQPETVRTPEQKQMADQAHKYYMQQEIKLRKNDSSGSLSGKKPPQVPVRVPEASPIWKRKGINTNGAPPPPASVNKLQEPKRMSNISEISEADSLLEVQCSSSPSSETISLGSETSLGYQRKVRLSGTPEHGGHGVVHKSDKSRKRTYRIGLNMFNKKPEKGIVFLCDHGFIGETPSEVAHFLITRKGLSKQMIGEYLGNLQKPFNQQVLEYFAQEIDLSGLQVDMALRKFQSYFRMPGEAQKIERLMEAFADRYCACNPDQIKNFRNLDTIFLLAFAIIMLNTDSHNSSIKAERKMKVDDFIRNLRDIDDGQDVDRDMLIGIYNRIQVQEFRAGVDHVTQVMKVEQTVVGKKPQLALPHRRLVCYCRLYEVHDPNKKEKIGLHQREVFLFNDLLLITKIFSKKKSGITYSYKQSFSLSGMQVYLFETSHYQYGVRLVGGVNNKVLITLNARNDHDRQKFVDDLREAILETNGMETIRIEEELQKHSANHNTLDRHYANDDSRVLMYELMKPSDPSINRLSAPDCPALQKLPLSNSLTDLCQGQGMRRGSSGGSLDSGVASGGSGGVVVYGDMTSQNSQTSLHSRGSPATPKTSQISLQSLGSPTIQSGVKGRRKQAVSLRKGLPVGTDV